jgi:putative peptidoglycan lipid II flippase
MFIVVGDVIVAAVYERGAFSHADTVAVWVTLAVLSVALMPATSSRLLQNGLYALDDPRTPARLGVLSVVLAAVIGAVLMFPLDHLFVGPTGIEGWSDMSFARLPDAVRENPTTVHLGIVGLALGTAISRWIEYRLLSTALAWRIGRTKMAGRWLGPIAAGSGVAAAVAYAAETVAGRLPAIPEAMVVVGLAGLAYLGVTRALAVPEAVATADRLGGLARRVRH